MRSTRAGMLALAILVVSCGETGTEPRTTAPPESRTGWILGPDRQPVQIWYSVVKGQAIWQGDINLGDASRIASTRDALSKRANYGLLLWGTLWPDGVVPYQLSYPDDGRVADAIAAIEATNTSLTFVPRTSESAYIQINQDDGCVTYGLGYSGGVRVIGLAGGCSTGSTIHELLHALGLGHEHNRCDRDNYVQVNWSNIDAQYQNQYQKVCGGYFVDIFPYDESSIMHYGPGSFSIGYSWTHPTMTSLRGRDADMGQRNGLSGGDINSLTYMYPLPNVYVSGPVDVRTGFCHLNYEANTPGIGSIASYSWSSSGTILENNGSWIQVMFPDVGGEWVELTVTTTSGAQYTHFLEIYAAPSGMEC